MLFFLSLFQLHSEHLTLCLLESVVLYPCTCMIELWPGKDEALGYIACLERKDPKVPRQTLWISHIDTYIND